MSHRPAIVVRALRTPMTRLDGPLCDVSAEELAATVITALLRDVDVPVDDVLLATAAGPGGNPARRAALAAGLDPSVPGLTLDRQCGGGLDAVTLACRLVEAGAGRLYVAGGTESASTSPLRALARPGERFFPRHRFSAGGWDDPGMAESAEIVAREHGVSRERQDAFAARSHRLAHRAVADGRFRAEITPVMIDGHPVDTDDCPRPTLTAVRIARVPPLFPGGTVTAASSSRIADGAAAVLVAAPEVARALGDRGLVHIDSAVAGVDPRECGMGAVPAVRRLRHRDPAFRPERAGHVAFTEAFASQTLATLDALGMDAEPVNPLGGAIGLGHPWGASGAVQVVRLFADMTAAPGDGEGLAMAAIAGGMGVAARFGTWAAS
ncbi:MAG: thiolase family protein [Thermoleophilia bacterium]